MFLSQQLANLLPKAGLPSEAECIGRIFAFNWSAEGTAYRVVGRIDGLKVHAFEGEAATSFWLTSAALPLRDLSRSRGPSWLHFESEPNHLGKILPPQWTIYFSDVPIGPGSSEVPNFIEGTFELLI